MRRNAGPARRRKLLLDDVDNFPVHHTNPPKLRTSEINFENKLKNDLTYKK
jgi:hypothetical protein